MTLQTEAKLKNLLTAINAATDLSDSNLTDAVKHLISRMNIKLQSRKAVTYTDNVVSDIVRPDLGWDGVAELQVSVDIPTFQEAIDTYFNHQLTSITINAKNIGTYSMYLQQKLTQIDFTAVTRIQTQAFRNCTALATVIIRSESVCTLDDIQAFRYTPIESGTGSIYVTDDLVDEYKSATNWSSFADSIKPLSEYEGG